MTTTSRPFSGTDPRSSDQLHELARLAIVGQSATTVTVLSSLLAAHDALRYLPYEAIEEVARGTGSSVNEVWSVASFYPNFRFTPPTHHLVEVCWGPTCHVLGAQTILQGLVRHLNLEGEGDTADGKITLKYNTCLGVCPHAPAASFDHELVGHMSLEEAVGRIDVIKASDAQHDLGAERPEPPKGAPQDRSARPAQRKRNRPETDKTGSADKRSAAPEGQA